jgi:hypothetical protein
VDAGDWAASGVTLHSRDTQTVAKRMGIRAGGGSVKLQVVHGLRNR